jgi:hypothetical protein
MGTRHLILVYYKGQCRICQYGQWDGQPGGQGLTCLHFLFDEQNIINLRKVLDHSDNCLIVIESLSRNTGADILNVVARATPEGPVKVYLWEMEFLHDEVFLEWAWVVDLDSKVLESYTGCNYKVLDQKSRFVDVLESVKPLPGVVAGFRFDELPNGRRFLAPFEALDMDGEVEEEDP